MYRNTLIAPALTSLTRLRRTSLTLGGEGEGERERERERVRERERERGQQMKNEVLNHVLSLSLYLPSTLFLPPSPPSLLSLSHFSIILLAFISILGVFGPTCLITFKQENDYYYYYYYYYYYFSKVIEVSNSS